MYKRVKVMKSHNQVLFSVVIAFAVIAFWRGVWGFLDLFLFPSNLHLSFILSIVLGLSILIVTHYVTKELT